MTESGGRHGSRLGIHERAPMRAVQRRVGYADLVTP